DIRDALRSGNTYQIQASVKVRGNSAAQPIQAWLYIQDDSGTRWQSLAETEATPNTWQTLHGQFPVDINGDLLQARLHLFGPAVGYELLIDDLTVKPL